jgi:REP element-mobilizing transposase RayT
MTIKNGQGALRKGRVSEPGRIYLVTCVAWNRAPVFRHYRAARVASRAIHSPKSWGDAQCLAWVLMPDHWHGLIQVGEEDLSKVINRLKSRVSKAIRAEEGRRSPLWQRAFHDRALRDDEDVRDAARYVVANPIRAGLVQRAGQYPYWNAIWL